MQVKCKLQAVVNNRDIICTLNFSLFLTALVYLLWYVLQWLTASQQYDSVCCVFAFKCVEISFNHGCDR